MKKHKKEAPAMAFHLPPKAEKRRASAEDDLPMADPRALLKKALARHDLHMSGAEPVTDEAQGKLREDLQAALDALDAEEKGEE